MEQGPWLAKKNLQIGTSAAITLSALGVPAAWAFLPPLYIHQYAPQAFWDGGLSWRQVMADMERARDHFESNTANVSENGWKSEDGREFEKHADRFQDDLQSIEFRAACVCAVLFLSAILTMTMILLMTLIAALLAMLAIWVLIASINPLSAATARLKANETLIAVYNTQLRPIENLVATAMHSCAALLGALISEDVVGDAVRGDLSGARDFADGMAAQGPMLLWGGANRLERDLTAFGFGGTFPAGGFYGGLAGDRAGQVLPTLLPPVAGVKVFNDAEYTGGSPAITGRFAPEQNSDGSYAYPWE
ncbi:hypothetical protein [Nonomuraea basaltis]|uniref:hypothetical protein n=1 Tax=Nonomuraea basaltis TaxID=2495887 RepID=UPI00110C4314|nr:hypothetical protein [Nonomuraea basaltis]TMR90414.1 hypothetical protein EJK15_55545 [Nonomuraea basaltis]